MRSPLISRAIKFLFVGAVGFVVDLSTFAFALYTLHGGPFLARGLALPIAITATWLLNRSFTFAERRRTAALPEVGSYIASSLLAATVNYAVYAAFLFSLGSFPAVLFCGICAGVGSGLLVNFFLYSKVVFPSPGRAPRLPPTSA